MLRRSWPGAVLLLGILTCPALAQEVKLEWKLKKDEKFYLQSVTTFDQTLKTLGKDIKQKTEQTTVFSLTVKEVNPDKSVVLEQKLESFALKNLNMMAPATDDKFNQQMVGATFKVTIDAKGDVTKFEGYDDLVKKLAGDDAAAKKIFQATMPEETLRRSVAELFGFLPDTPVKKDDKGWERKSEIHLGPLGSFETTKTYTYEGQEKVDGKMLDKITWKAETKYALPTKGEAGAFPFQVVKGDLKAEDFKGTILFDNAAGRLVSYTRALKLKGNVTISVMNTNIDSEVLQDETEKATLSDKPPMPAKP